MRIINAIVILAAIGGLAGCGGVGAPSPVPSSSTELAVFLDRETGFSTTDVRDAQDQIVQFNTRGELVWTTGARRFPGFIADGQVVTADRICAGCYFLVRFGSVGNERRAYLTWAGDDSPDNPARVLDVDVTGNQLTVVATDVRVPRG